MPANIYQNIFKVYDIRGKYPAEINEKIVCEIISALISNFKNQPAAERKKLKIIVAHDARLSSPNLYRAAINGIMNQESGIMNNKTKNKKQKTVIHKSKFIILPIGLATTPMFYFLVNKLKADFGIMITASHNPKEYNGLKIVGKNAKPINGKEILKAING